MLELIKRSISDGVRHSGNVLRDFNNNEKNCTAPSQDQFPSGLFTQSQREDGAVVIHVLVTLYMFVTMAIICEHYFVPAIEKFTEVCKVSQSVAGASVMAAGASVPQLCVTVIGLFVAKDDIGVGAVIGSSFFNVLFVPAACGFAVTGVLTFRGWPTVRDCVAFMIAGIILTITIVDEQIEWYEAFIMIVAYIMYIVVLGMNPWLEEWAARTANWFKTNCKHDCCKRQEESDEKVLFAGQKGEGIQYYESVTEDLKGKDTVSEILTTEDGPFTVEKKAELLKAQEKEKEIEGESFEMTKNGIPHVTKVKEDEEPPKSEYKSLLSRPSGKCLTVAWVIMLPACIVLTILIPDFRRPGCWRHLLWMTLLMSVVCIGFTSYILIWMISIIGDTMYASPTVMGMTVLAAGSSFPDLLNSIFAARNGYGEMAMANALGSNMFDLLFCLGLPWLIDYLFVGDLTPVPLEENLAAVAICLISTAVLVLFVLAIARWTINKKIAAFFLVSYLVYIIACAIYEANHSLPLCDFD